MPGLKGCLAKGGSWRPGLSGGAESRGAELGLRLGGEAERARSSPRSGWPWGRGTVGPGTELS